MRDKDEVHKQLGLTPVQDIDRFDQDVMFKANMTQRDAHQSASPLEAVIANELANYVPEDNPAKINLEDRAEMVDYVRVRLLVDLFPEVPDLIREAILNMVENREAYSNSIQAGFRKELSGIFRAGAGDGDATAGEVIAAGFGAKLRDDLTPDDDN